MAAHRYPILPVISEMHTDRFRTLCRDATTFEWVHLFRLCYKISQFQAHNQLSSSTDDTYFNSLCPVLKLAFVPSRYILKNWPCPPTWSQDQGMILNLMHLSNKPAVLKMYANVSWHAERHDAMVAGMTSAIFWRPVTKPCNDIRTCHDWQCYVCHMI